MSNAAFRSLVREFASVAGFPDPDQVAETCQFEVDGFQVAVFYDDLLKSDTIFTYIDFGAIPIESEHAAHRAMLETNLIVGGVDAGVLGIHPDTGHAIFSVHLAFAPDLTGHGLAATIGHYIEQAQSWRQIFSPEPPLTPAPLPSDSSVRTIRTY